MGAEIIGWADIVGASYDGGDVVGADLEAMFGAAPAKRAVSPQNFRQMHPGQVMLAQRQPSHGYTIMCPIPETVIVKATTAQVQFRPQVDGFRIDQLYLGAAAITNMDFISMTVGNQPMTTQPGTIPGALFTAANTVRLRGLTCSNGRDITLQTRNNDAANNQTLTGIFTGPAVY